MSVRHLTTNDDAADVSAMLTRLGLSFTRVETLSAPAFGRKRQRRTLRVDLVDGSTIKVRQLESAHAATELSERRRQLPEAFAPVLACEGAVLLEAWIPGRTLTNREAELRADELGIILAGLHATGRAITSARIDTAPRRAQAVAQLAQLIDAGAISAATGAALEGEMRDADPGTAPASLVHIDYCPENVVVDDDGRLHVIDNEWIAVEAAGLDLGRTWARWPVSDHAWARFVRGYVSASSFGAADRRFWMIVMAAASAALRLQSSAAELAVPLARLHQLAVVSSL